MRTDSVRAGAILAGGRSRRMGCDKAALRVAGITLLDRAVQTLRPLVSSLYIVGGARTHEAATCVEDRYPGQGPLNGIYSVLTRLPTSSVMVLAVDTPLLRTCTLRRLDQYAAGFDITVVRTMDGRIHPLSGIYSTRCCEPIEDLLAGGRLRVDALFEIPSLRVNIVDASLLDCIPGEFTNVNTPRQLREVRRQLSRDPVPTVKTATAK